MNPSPGYWLCSLKRMTLGDNYLKIKNMGTKTPKINKPGRDNPKPAKEKNPEGLDLANAKIKKACSYKLKPQDVKLLVCIEKAFKHKFASIEEFLEKIKSLNG